MKSFGPGPKIEIDKNLLIGLLEPLRLAPIYALLHTEHVDTITADFKPLKWEGHELEYANEAIAAYKRLLDALMESS